MHRRPMRKRPSQGRGGEGGGGGEERMKGDGDWGRGGGWGLKGEYERRGRNSPFFIEVWRNLDLIRQRRLLWEYYNLSRQRAL